MDKPAEVTIGSWFAEGWATYKECRAPLIVGSVVLSIITLINMIASQKVMLVWPSLFFSFLINPVLMVGWNLLCLNCIRREPASVADIVIPFNRYFTIIAMLVVVGLAYIIGLILLVIPGIYIMLRFSLCWYVVFDRNVGPLKTLDYTSKITKGHLLKLLGMNLLVGLMGVLTWPVLFSFMAPLAEYSNGMLLVGIVPYLIYMGVVLPFAGASMAASYESISKDWESRQRVEPVIVAGTDYSSGLG